MKIWKVLLLVSFLVYAVQCAPEAQDAEPEKVEDTPKVEDTKEEETPTLEDEEDTEDEESEENDEENDEEEQSDEEDKEEDNAVEKDEDEDAGRYKRYRRYRKIVNHQRRLVRCYPRRPICPYKKSYYLRKLCSYGLIKARKYGKGPFYKKKCKCYRYCTRCKTCRWCRYKKYRYRYRRVCSKRKHNCWCRTRRRYSYPKPYYG